MRRYMESCDMYQRMTNRVKIPAGKLKLNEISKKPQIYLMMDFITKLPLVAGKYVIMIVCDRLSKIIYFVATTEEISAE